MPIRMVDDPQDQYDNSNENTGGGRRGGGGGGGLIQFLPLIISLLFRRPKLLIVVAIVGILVYFAGGLRSCGGLSSTNSFFATGGVLDPEEFEKAQIYEGLSPDKTDLPESVSLLKFAPDRKDQGEQGSCVAWSSAYAARSILEAETSGKDPNSVAFSPSFLYNQIGLRGCQGSYIIRAMENMQQVGAVPFNAFPYNENDCTTQPDPGLKQNAQQFRMLGFTRLTDGDKISTLDLHAVKQHLAKDVPVVIGMMVGGTFMHGMMGQEVWHPTQEDYSEMGFGGHAMCIIGYDDRKEGGAFQIMNSWGPDWGKNGIGWVRYKDFKHFAKEAYGLNQMPKTNEVQNIACSIGLVENKTHQYIPLQLTSGNVFSTKSPISKGTQFKIEVKNNTECYVYVLGMETDGSSYILFPYPTKEDPTKTKFSPYCGITGYRLFPRGMSMMADSIGNKDYMTVIVSKDSLNVFALNRTVNDRKNMGYTRAVNTAAKRESIQDINFTTDNSGTISFHTAVGDKNAVACIVEIEKK